MLSERSPQELMASNSDDDWDANDPETARAMVGFLLDELQPNLWTKRKDAISTFSGFFFRTNPILPSDVIQMLLVGDEQRKGLLHAIGQISWKSFRLKQSSVAALNMLIEIIDPEKNGDFESFEKNFSCLDDSVYRAMKLEKHISDPLSRKNALKIVALLQRFNRSVPLATNASGVSTPERKISSSITLYEPDFCGPESPSGKRKNIGSIMSKIGNLIAGRPTVTSLMHKGIVQTPKVFGLPIDDVVRVENGVECVPAFLVQCCDFLRQHGIDKVGLFRVSGDQHEILRIKHMLDYAEEFTLDGINPHSIAGIVKTFFRDLAEPLLSFDMYDKMVEAARSERWKDLTQMYENLPHANLLVSQYLFSFLAEVSFEHVINKMTSANIAIVFAPNLMRSRVESFEAIAKDTPVTISVVRFLIEKAMPDKKVKEINTALNYDDKFSAVTLKSEVSSPWVQYLDEKNGTPYFYNSTTGDSCWKPPCLSDKTMHDEANVLRKNTHSSIDNTSLNLTRNIFNSEHCVSVLDDANNYGNGIEKKLKNHSSNELNETTDVRKTSMSHDWQEFEDDLSGNAYFFNNVTGETTWLRPHSLLQPENSCTTSTDACWEPASALSNATTTTTFVSSVSCDTNVSNTHQNTIDDSHTIWCHESQWDFNTSGGSFPTVSWFKNPQYLVKLSPSNASRIVHCELTTATADEPIGVHVLLVDENRVAAQGRILKIMNDEDLLAFGPFNAADSYASIGLDIEVLASVTSIMVIPSTENAGYEASFTLKLSCLQGICVDVVTEPILKDRPWFHTMQSSQWTATTAGGCYPNFMSWRHNPQFKFNIDDRSRPVRALVHVQRATHENIGEDAIGFYVFRNRGPGSHKMCISEGDVVSRSEFVTSNEVCGEIHLEALIENSDEHLIILPCTYLPGVIDSFDITVYSDQHVELALIDSSLKWRSTPVVRGSWNLATAGGCRNFVSWKSNPRFKMTLSRPSRIVCVLAQPNVVSVLPIGFYVLNNTGKVRAKAPFMVAPEVFCDVDLDPEEGPFLIVPCTFDPGQLGDFGLFIFTVAPIILSVL